MRDAVRCRFPVTMGHVLEESDFVGPVVRGGYECVSQSIGGVVSTDSNRVWGAGEGFLRRDWIRCDES